MSQGLYNPFFQNGAYWYGQGGSDHDNSANTNGSDQQVWAFIGDSMLQTSDTRMADATFQNTIYQSVSGVISAVGASGFTGETEGSFMHAFGNELYKVTGKKMVGVRSTVGGSKVYLNGADPTWWTTGTLRATAESNNSSALSANGTTKLRGIWTCVGINDATAAQSLANIETAVNSYYAWINTTYPEVPVYVLNIGRNVAGEDSRVIAIRGYHVAAVAQYSHMHIVANLADYVNMYHTDLIHLNAFGNDKVAQDCIRAMLTQGLIANRPITRTYGSASSAVFAYSAFATLSTERKNILADLIDYLDQVKGDWVNIDSICIPILGTEAESLQDLKRSTKQMSYQTVSGTPVWTSSNGIRTNGGAIKSNFIPLTDGTPTTGFIGNNNWASVLVRNRYSATGTKRTLFGAIGSTADRAIYLSEKAAGGYEWKNNAATAGTTADGSGTITAQNIWGNRRNGSTSFRLFRNHSELSIANVTVVAALDAEISIGALNTSGVYSEEFDADIWGWVFPSSSLADVLQIIAQMRLAATKLSLL